MRHTLRVLDLCGEGEVWSWCGVVWFGVPYTHSQPQVEFSNTDIDMYWLSPSGSSCDFTVYVGAACGYRFNKDFCALKLGEFTESETFDVHKRTSKERTLEL